MADEPLYHVAMTERQIAAAADACAKSKKREVRALGLLLARKHRWILEGFVTPLPPGDGSER